LLDQENDVRRNFPGSKFRRRLLNPVSPDLCKLGLPLGDWSISWELAPDRLAVDFERPLEPGERR
jgi:hypothetical protein